MISLKDVNCPIRVNDETMNLGRIKHKHATAANIVRKLPALRQNVFVMFTTIFLISTMSMLGGLT